MPRRNRRLWRIDPREAKLLRELQASEDTPAPRGDPNRKRRKKKNRE